jgi:hypothetical protein
MAVLAKDGARRLDSSFIRRESPGSERAMPGFRCRRLGFERDHRASCVRAQGSKRRAGILPPAPYEWMTSIAAAGGEGGAVGIDSCHLALFMLSDAR